MASSKSSDEVLSELRAAAKARRRRKPQPVQKLKPRNPSQTALTIRTLKARASQDPEFATILAHALGVYQPLAEEWCAGSRRPSPVRLRQIRKYLAGLRES